MTASGDRALMRLHVETLFTHDARGDLVAVNEPDGRPAPRFFLGVTTGERIIRCRYDVELETRSALQSLLEAELPDAYWTGPSTRLKQYEAALARSAPVQRTWAGPAFSFPPELPAVSKALPVTSRNSSILQPFLGAWIQDVQSAQPMFAATVDDIAVAVCCSVRRTGQAHEAGAETAPSYRGRGYAGAAVTAWATAVRALGIVPLYSTSWSNEASRALARKLTLRHFGSDLHIT